MCIRDSIYTALCLIITIIFWAYFYSISRNALQKIRDHLINLKLEESRNKLPFLSISTRSNKARGCIWNLFDDEVLILKTLGGNFIYIPWNEISWVEVIEKESQNNIVIKEVDKSKWKIFQFIKKALTKLRNKLLKSN